MYRQRYKLSFCIPTYNRVNFIIKGLKYLSNIPLINKVEILVFDDGSTDNTENEIKLLLKNNTGLNVNYFKFKKHQGFDKVVSVIVKKAKGEFCWLISDDDLPREDSIKKILSIIDKKPSLSLIHVNYSRFDNVLQKVTSEKMVGSINKDIYFNNADDFLFKNIFDSYFNFLGTNVITMSTDIVNRKKWIKASIEIRRFYGHNFIHCFIIAKMIKEDSRIYYVAEPIVQYLSNNHRIWPNDIWKDYNNIFLEFLKDIGYSKEKINLVREAQIKYEKREGVMKHPLLKYVYGFISPIYAKIQYLKSKYGRRFK
jgi:abequosyltransferase